MDPWDFAFAAKEENVSVGEFAEKRRSGFDTLAERMLSMLLKIVNTAGRFENIRFAVMLIENAEWFRRLIKSV